MSNQTQVYLDNANFSKAAYANLKKETCNQDRLDNIDALKKEGFSQDQAEQFLDKYKIFDVLNDPISGANAVIFAEKLPDGSTGQKTLAIRGTELTDIGDIHADQELAVLGLTSKGQYSAIKNFYDNAVTTGVIATGESVNVTGHSLGGFLATCFTLLNQSAVDHAYTYNSPGIFGAVFQVLTGMGLIPDNLPFDKITHIYNNLSPTLLQGWGILIGDIVEVPGRWHGLQSIIDGLSKTGAYYRADNNLHWLPIDLLSAIFGNSETYQTLSPIILDLDGDGIETTNIQNGTYFDLDADGFAEKIGWVSPDDGFLVMDRDGNGTIDSGRELFGNETLLSNGLRAWNGFVALGELDANGDGKIDANDPSYSQLRVWKDTNGDGYSSSDELFTLDSLGIQSINTGYTSSTYVDQEGNEHRQRGSFTRTDGSSGTITDVWFQQDTTDAISTEYVEETEAIQALPDLHGNGSVYSLHQAMARDASSQLETLVEQFVAETDIIDRNALMEQILYKWAAVDEVDPASRGGSFDARKLSMLEKFLGDQFVGVGGVTDPNTAAARLLNIAYKEFSEWAYAGLMSQTHLLDLYTEITYVWDEATQSVRGNLSAVTDDIISRIAADPVTGTADLGEFARTICGFQAEEVLDFQQFRNAFASLGEEYLWVIDSANRLVMTGTAEDDLITASETTGNALYGGDGNDVLYGSAGSDALYGGPGDDQLIASQTAGGYASCTGDVLNGGAGNDTLVGGQWDDTLEGGEGDDQLVGGNTVSTGNDYLSGGPGNDTLIGLDGNDTYYFNLGDGQDVVIDNGLVKDSNSIEFGAGITKDNIIVNKNGYDLEIAIAGTSDKITINNWYQSSRYQIDIFRFGDGTVMTKSELQNMVVVQGNEWNDAITGTEENDKIHGGAGNDALYGGKGDDALWGDDDADSLYGGEGNDSIQGGKGNDILMGNSGSDTLDGGAGDDTLRGGLGNDTYLYGRGAGNDTIENYEVTVAGHDTGYDEILFGEGLTTDSLDFLRDESGNGNNLIIRIKDTGETLIVNQFFNGEEYRVDSFKFADETFITGSDIYTQLSPGTGQYDDTIEGTEYADNLNGGAGNDTISGGLGDDTIHGGIDNDILLGGAGDDTLYGDDGDDTLDGGPGNDVLVGGSGSDVYIFGEGSGNDTIFNDASSPLWGNNNGYDTVQFGDGITISSLEFVAEERSLVIRIKDTDDTLRLDSFFGGGQPPD